MYVTPRNNKYLGFGYFLLLFASYNHICLKQFEFPFSPKIDTLYCARLIAGCQIKNKGKEMLPGGWNNWWSSKGFRVSGSLKENGPWETLVEDQLVDTTFSGGKRPASLLNFTFKEPVEIQFIKFDLISYWGGSGGGLQYFAAIPATSKGRGREKKLLF